MRTLISIFCAAVLSLGLVAAASAHPPADLADLVGARSGQGELQLDRLGYVNKRKNNWWKESEGICVKMTVSQGRYKAIDIVKPADCGMNVSSDHGPGAGCPSDVSEANRYLYPDCDKPNGGNNGSGAPRAVLIACAVAADTYQGVAPGTSRSVGAKKSGGNWVLKMSSGSTYKSTCTATSNGQVLDMNPGY